MRTSIKKIGLILIIIAASCSSSDDDMFSDTPTLNNTTPEQLSKNIKLITDNFDGEDYIVVGSEGWNFIVAFNTEINGKILSFEAIQNSLPIIMEDNEGSRYDIFGKAVGGTNSGQKLTPMNAFIGYWFAWGTFYPGLEIYENSLPTQNVGASVQGSDGWLIPREHVFTGALRNAIPAIDSPVFFDPKNDNIENLNENELVIIVNANNIIKTYPHYIMNWHEVVNDKSIDLHYSVVFCPLTGTATAWNREIDGHVTTFGVSGFLYNNNVVPYDRNSMSNWSQMLQKSVQGELSGNKTDNLFVLETSLKTWRVIGNNLNILSPNTGFGREYSRNPYGNYPVNSSIIFPVNFVDTRLHPKERVLGVIVNEKARAYRIETFR